MKVILELDRATLSGKTSTRNRIAYGIIHIVRMPEQYKLALGKSVGEQIQGQIVLQYAGPLTILVDKEKKKKKAVSKKKGVKR